MVDLGRGWLLVGQDAGKLGTVPWDAAGRTWSTFDAPSEGDGIVGRTSLVDILDDDLVIISHQGGTWVCAIHWQPFGPTVSPINQLQVQRGPPHAKLGIRSLACTVVSKREQGRPLEWLLLSESGSIYSLRRESHHFAAEYLTSIEGAGLISDFAVIKPTWMPGRTRPIRKCSPAGVYLATSRGLYLVSVRHPTQPRRIMLPGLGETLVAVSFFADSRNERRRRGLLDTGRCFLWASDLGGNAHLLETGSDAHQALIRDRPAKMEGTHSPWRPCGVHQHGVHNLRAFLSWNRPTAGDKTRPLLVAQACRDDQIIVSLFAEDLAPDRSSSPRAASRNNRPFLVRVADAELPDLRRWVDNHRALDGPQTHVHPGREWPASALVAEFFEWAADDGPEDLADFLRQPTATLAVAALNEETHGMEPRQAAGIAARILLMWTHTLLGALHHLPLEPHRKPYNGIIVWLRAVQDGLRRAAWALEPSFHNGVDRAVRDTYKWGLHGELYRQSRGLAALCRYLDRRASPDKPDGHETLVYRAQLLAQRFDVEAEASEISEDGNAPPRVLPAQPDFTGWDIKIDDHYDKDVNEEVESWERIVVASWSHGLELHQLRYEASHDVAPGNASVHSRSGWSLTRLWPELDSRKTTEGPARYARSVVIGRSVDRPDRPLLICARRSTTGRVRGSDAQRRRETKAKHHSERLEICDLTQVPTSDSGHLPGKLLNLRTKGSPDLCAVKEEEAVHSLLDLEAGLVLVGLKGRAGFPRLGILHIPSAAGARFYELALPLSPASPPGQSVDENPIWAMAACRSRNPSNKDHLVTLGCDDGAVWVMRVPRRSELNKLGWDRLDHWWAQPEHRPERIGILGCPVWCLVMRDKPHRLAYQGSHADEEDPRADELSTRVVAGGKDGSIVAWQYRRLSWHSRAQTRWAPIWATREAGPVSRLHLFDRVPDNLVPEASECERRRSHWALVAFTHKGRGIVFLDRPAIETPQGIRRLWVPGQRLDRIDLGFPVFASDIVRGAPSNRQWPRMLIASSDHRLRLVQPLYLRNTYARQDEFRELLNRWESTVSFDDGFFDLRLHEAMCSASERLSLLPIRWLMRRTQTEDPLPTRWFLPRRIRVLVDLVKEWRQALRSQDHAERASAAEEVGRCLQRCLRRCRKYHGPELYREVIEAVLQQMNRDLVNDPGIGIALVATEVMAVLFDTEELWIGAADQTDLQLKIASTKALLDGTVLHQLSVPSGQPDLWAALLEDRVYLAERFLGQGDALLTLEVLRAVNLSLVRYARLTCDQTSSEVSLPWAKVGPFFWKLKSVAGRFGSSGPGLDVSLFHEICRGFALAICCHPDKAFLVCHLLSEANLTGDVFQAVAVQLRALEELGVVLPEKAIDRFELATAWREPVRRGLNLLRPKHVIEVTGATEADLPTKLLGPEALLEILSDKFLHEDNVPFARAWLPWHWLLDQLVQLARALEEHPAKISLAWLVELRAILRGIQEPNARESSQDYYYRDTRAFWTDHLVLDRPEQRHRKDEDWLSLAVDLGFDAAVEEDDSLEPPPLRPEVLTKLRPALRLWCDRVIKDIPIRKSQHRLFEPEATIYTNVVSRIGQAALKLPYSAAVLSSVVVGVLSHGLLESLVDHVFEFEAVARTIDPVQESVSWRPPTSLGRERNGSGSLSEQVCYHDDSEPEHGSEGILLDEASSRRAKAQDGDPIKRVSHAHHGRSTEDRAQIGNQTQPDEFLDEIPAGIAARFAAHLRRLRDNAADVPRALLTLKELLANPGLGDAKRELDQLFDQHRQLRRIENGWRLENPMGLRVSEREARFLLLVLAELEDNDRKHGLEIERRSSLRAWPYAVAEVRRREFAGEDDETGKTEQQRVAIDLWFSYVATRIDGKPTEERKRLELCKQEDLRAPVEPSMTSRGLSHGTGLYMARIAAALVGWTVKIVNEFAAANDVANLQFRLDGPWQ